MTPPPPDSPFRDEWDLLHELRDNPRLLQLAAEATGSELHVQAQLRREFSDRLVRGALTVIELRRKGEAKFSRAGEMWFDRHGLEQATSEPVAHYKARRFEGDVWDFCCGVGGDCVALAERCQVTAVDLNPVACLRTVWNAEGYGRGARVTPLSGTVEGITSRQGLAHIDPDRRRNRAARAVRIEDYVPGPEFLQRMTEEFPGGAIKLSPAANFGGKFPGTEIELISLHGECKEATIWFGDLISKSLASKSRGVSPRSGNLWRATVLPAGESITGDPLEFAAEITDPRGYLYDPDPAVVRAGLVDVVAGQLGLSRLDEQEEYLTGADRVTSPFVQTFELVAELPNNPAAIRNHFRQSDVGQLEIKCRHIPIDADAVRRKLTLPGDQPGVLVFARVQGKSRALVCRRIPKTP